MSWIVHVRGPVCGAWAGCGQISAPSDQISGPKGPRSRRRDHGPIQISGGCSDRYLVAVVADILSAEPDIWSAADIWWPSTRYLVPWVHDPAGGMLDPTRYLVRTTRYLVTAMYSRAGLPVAQLGLRFSTVPVQQPLHQACSGPSLHMGLRPRASVSDCHWRTWASPHPLQRFFLWKLPVHN